MRTHNDKSKDEAASALKKSIELERARLRWRLATAPTPEAEGNRLQGGRPTLRDVFRTCLGE